MKPLGSQVAVTVLVIVGWLVFNLLFSAFFYDKFYMWQASVITNASLLIAGGIVSAIWIKWAIK